MTRIVLRSVTVLTILASAIAVTTSATPRRARALGGEQKISGKRLLLKENPNPVGRKIAVRSNDAAITLGGGNGSADDPTLFGGSLRVRTSNGDLFDGTYDLPAAAWTTIGAQGQNRGYRFTSETGPIKSVIVVPGRRIKVTGRGAFTQSLSTNPNPVDVVLRTGANRYCLEFGGTVTFQAVKRFRAIDGPAPSSCPALADWPTYGFDLAR